jgi:Flp pilus assembly protein TadD
MRIAPIFAALLLPIAAHAAAPVQKDPLTVLFVELAKAPSEEAAKPIEGQIQAIFAQSGSPTVELLMTRAEGALAAGDKDTASHLIDSILNITPDFAEAWHRRAALQAGAGDDANAMISLQRTVSLNPRQFEAYSELGDMLEGYGDKKAALAAFRKAQALDPQMEGIGKHIESLAREAEGEKI